MKTSTKDKIEGSFREVAGTIKEGRRKGYEGPQFESRRES